MNEEALSLIEEAVDTVITRGDATHWETIVVLQHMIDVLIDEDVEAAVVIGNE